MTLKNPLCKEFLDVQEKFRKILIDLNGNKNYENDYKNLNEFFEIPPVNWTKMSIQEKINKCISTYVYALDKKLKIDSEIIETLGKCLGKDHEEMSRELEKLTNKFYDGKKNVIG